MTNANTDHLSIGWASRDVTPDRPVNLCGQFHMRISKGVKDPVTVTALALSAGSSPSDQIIFVSCDTVVVSKQAFAQIHATLRQQAPEINPDWLIISATHTHTAPCLPSWVNDLYPPVPAGVMTAEEYMEIFVKGLVAAVMEAWRNRKPGGISFGLGTAVVGHNRRATYFEDVAREDNVQTAGKILDGYTKMYGNTNDPKFSHIEGYEDHYVDLLYTWDAKQQLTGVLVNLPCPSQETEGDYYVSADFWHEIRQEIKKRHGDEIQILTQCSAAGDQSPHRLWYKAAEERMLKLRNLSMRQEIGRRVANAVDEVLPFAKQAIQTALPLKHVVKEIKLLRRMVTDEEASAVRADLEKLEASDKSVAGYTASLCRCQQVLERYETQKKEKTLPMILHVVRLGDVAFATNRFEYYLDFGIRIKARSPAVQTFIVQLTADPNGTATYLPSERTVTGKGYGSTVYDYVVGPEGGQTIVEETVNTLRELWPEGR
jgi:hypothetical protein